MQLLLRSENVGTEACIQSCTDGGEPLINVTYHCANKCS